MAAATGKLPRALQEQPVITEQLLEYIEAYGILSYFRKETGTIGFDETLKYGKELGFEQPLEFVQMMITVDRAFTQEVKADKTLVELKTGEDEAS